MFHHPVVAPPYQAVIPHQTLQKRLHHHLRFKKTVGVKVRWIDGEFAYIGNTLVGTASTNNDT